MRRGTRGTVDESLCVGPLWGCNGAQLRRLELALSVKHQVKQECSQVSQVLESSFRNAALKSLGILL